MSYLETSFTRSVVTQELNDPNCYNYLVKFKSKNVGILKITIDQGWGNWTAKDALYLHRLYLLKKVTGKNIGKAALDHAYELANNFCKKIIWLETMKKGDAKNFYQKHGYEIIGDSQVVLPRVLTGEKEMWVMAKHV